MATPSYCLSLTRSRSCGVMGILLAICGRVCVIALALEMVMGTCLGR